MKTLNLFLAMLVMSAGAVFGQTGTTLFQPEENVAYTLKTKGGLNLYATTEESSISGGYQLASTGEEFEFAGNTTDGYTIRSTSSGAYLGVASDGSSLTDTPTRWLVVKTNNGQGNYYYYLHRKSDYTGNSKKDKKLMSAQYALVNFYKYNISTSFSSSQDVWVLESGTERNVTIEYVYGSDVVGTHTEYMELGFSIKTVAEANVPEGFFLTETTFESVVAGKYTYRVPVNMHEVIVDPEVNGNYTSAVHLRTLRGTQTVDGLQSLDGSVTLMPITWDRTSVTLTCATGETLYPSVDFHGEGMNAYFWIDEGNDGYACTANNSKHTISGDLKAWSRYTFSNNANATGWDNMGHKRGIHQYGMGTCVAPTTAGTYNARFMVAKNCINPKGYTGISADQGIIVDVKLQVVAPDPIEDMAVLYSRIYDNRGVMGGYTEASVEANRSALNNAERYTEMMVNYMLQGKTAPSYIRNLFNSTFTTLAKIERETLVVQTPRPGRFYRIKAKTSDRYMLGATTAWEKSADQVLTTAQVAYADRPTHKQSLFYVTEDGNILSMSEGKYLNRGCTQVMIDDAAGLGRYEFTRNYEQDIPALNLEDMTAYRTFTSDSTLVADLASAGRIDRLGRTDATTAWVLEEVDDMPISLSSAGYTAFFTPTALNIASVSGLEAFACELDLENSVVNMIDVTSVPANSAVVLKVAGAGSSTVAVKMNYDNTEEPLAGDDNCLTGSVSTITVEPYSTMQLGTNKKTGKPMFAKTSATTVKGFKGYIDVSNTNVSNARELMLNLDEMASAIDAARDDTMREGEMYNIRGQRVTKADGLVIVNGKKVKF